MSNNDISAPLHIEAITAVILAGGRGSRMGGVDKGLQNFNGVPLALHALLRLGPQVGEVMINANRNLGAYESFGVPVWPDNSSLGDYAGPLAGFMTGLERCETPYMLTLPCDTPLFPQDLVSRMAAAFIEHDADFAMVAAREENPNNEIEFRPQPVFCLMRTGMLESLMRFTKSGGRKIDNWTALHKTVLVPFDRPDDDPQAFFNANTLTELHLLESRLP